MTDSIDRIRHFNRTYLQHMGLLSRDYLGTGLSVTELRVLYDIHDGSARTTRALAERLSLDEGYLSRVLSRFVSDDLIARSPFEGDARIKQLSLTDKGVEYITDRIAEMRAAIVERLGRADSMAVANAMNAIEDMLGLATTDEVTVRDLAPGDAGWAVQVNAEYYAKTDGFDASFEALVAEILSDFLRNRNPDRDRAFILERGGRRLGSLFIVQGAEPDTAQLRLFFLVPEVRGQGLGKRLIDAGLSFARSAGYTRIWLWTHEAHEAAGRLYARNGFHLAATKPVHSFGTDQIEQHWVRDL